MWGAFIIQLGRESKPAQRKLEGWVEEVDSGEQLRFRSTAELLAFMSLRLQVVASEPGNPLEKHSDQK
jgi:hypothetical protein